MLSIVINDALNGIEINKKHPAFYARLLAKEELRTAFLDTLELLELSRTGGLADVQSASTLNLDFLCTMTPVPTIKKLDRHRWRLSWHKSVQRLKAMFETAAGKPDSPYRENDLLLDDQQAILMHGLARAGGREFEIKVDISRSMAAPGVLKLSLAVLTSESGWAGLTAEIVWGRYQQSASADHLGRFHFPPLRVHQITGCGGRRVEDFDCRLTINGTG